MTDCQYSRYTGRRWVYNDSTNCVVVECRAPQAIQDARRGRWFFFKGMDGVRFAVDEKFQPIPNADFLQVRSKMCNNNCPYYSVYHGTASLDNNLDKDIVHDEGN